MSSINKPTAVRPSCGDRTTSSVFHVDLINSNRLLEDSRGVESSHNRAAGHKVPDGRRPTAFQYVRRITAEESDRCRVVMASRQRHAVCWIQSNSMICCLLSKTNKYLIRMRASAKLTT